MKKIKKCEKRCLDHFVLLNKDKKVLMTETGIIEQLSDIRTGKVALPWGDGTIDIHFAKTRNGCAFGRLSDIACSMSESANKNALNCAIRDTLTTLALHYKQDLHESVLKVRYHQATTTPH